MNLAPSWIVRLTRLGFEAVHWSTIGAATAPDDEILAWAREHRYVVITNDLDFSAVLAASSGQALREVFPLYSVLIWRTSGQ